MQSKRDMTFPHLMQLLNVMLTAVNVRFFMTSLKKKAPCTWTVIVWARHGKGSISTVALPGWEEVHYSATKTGSRGGDWNFPVRETKPSDWTYIPFFLFILFMRHKALLQIIWMNGATWEVFPSMLYTVFQCVRCLNVQTLTVPNMEDLMGWQYAVILVKRGQNPARS